MQPAVSFIGAHKSDEARTMLLPLNARLTAEKFIAFAPRLRLVAQGTGGQ
jgi:hypothetical protein